MGKLFNALNNLKSNIFGGPGNTGFTKPPATRVGTIGLTDTPTSLLDVDPLAFASYSYPRDVTNNVQNGHYMLFYVNVQNKTKFEYTDPYDKPINTATKVRVPEGPLSLGKSKLVNIKGEIESKKAYFMDKAKKLTGNAYGSMKSLGINEVSLKSGMRNKLERTGIGSKVNTTKRVSDSVAIYLPPNVQDNTSATYNEMSTGMIGFAAAAGLDFSSAVGSKDYEAAAAVLTGGAATVAKEGAKKAGAAVAETLSGSEGATQLLNRAFGQADNPYMEVFFESMTMREFTYTFTFAPRNTDERDDAQKIIQLFRFHMSPEMRGGQSRFLGLPSEFDIHYMYQAKDGTNSENDYYNKIATCVLTNCVVDYTPGAVKSFADGSPVQITMALTFKETETLTRDKVNEGY